MHIEVIDDLNMIIYLNNSHIKSIDFNNKDDLQDYFENLFVNLKDYYNIKINGFYKLKVYKDKYYGMIIELEKEDIEYMDYFNDQVDMNIIIDKNGSFMYEIDDYFNINPNIIDKIKIYKFQNKLYLKIINFISEFEIGKILEFSNLVYGVKTEQILKHGQEIIIKKSMVNK